MFKKASRKAAAGSATRRIMSVTFADGREMVSVQCLKARRIPSHPPTHRLSEQAFAQAVR